MEIGAIIPDFTLKNQHNEDISLSSITKEKTVVLFFYPKDNTSGCTKEVCSFRDQYEDFKELKAEVIGVSSDSVLSHQNFAQKHRLPFMLLADEKGEVRKLFGVSKSFFLIPGRETFVINQNMKLIYKFNSLTNIDQHIQKAIQALKENNMA